MIEMRAAADRGQAHHGWLQSAHSFSFADYHDPRHMGFGPLRVINEDRVAPGMGFGTHGHRDMEIISYVLEGELAHRDSLGNGSVIRPGDVQRMSAGSGVRHSEFNHSQSATTHFLQIWIEPDTLGIAPGYEEKHVSAHDKRGRLALLASPADGQGAAMASEANGEGAVSASEANGEGAVRVHQDARLYAGLFDGDEQARLALAPGRLGYVHLARGRLVVNGRPLQAGDALKLADEPTIELADGQGAEVLVFDLPR